MCTHTRACEGYVHVNTLFWRAQKRTLDALGLKLYTIISHHMCAKNWSQILCKSNRRLGLISQLFRPVSFITGRIRERECTVKISQVCEVKSKSFHLLHMYSRQLFIHLSQSLFYIPCHVFLWLQYETLNLHWIHLVISYSTMAALYLVSCIYLLR